MQYLKQSVTQHKRTGKSNHNVSTDDKTSDFGMVVDVFGGEVKISIHRSIIHGGYSSYVGTTLITNTYV